MKLLDAHRSAVRQFDLRVRAIRPGQWANPTVDTPWTVRELVNHLTAEQLWAPELLAGRSPEEVGDRFDGDLLGEDPPAMWEHAATAAREAWSRDGALERSVRLSRGDTPAVRYLQEIVLDLTVHAWDLAMAVGAPEQMPNDLVATVLDLSGAVLPTGGPAFAPPITVAACTDDLTELLARTGRRR